MNASRSTLLLAVLSASSLAWADSSSLGLCYDTQNQDKQPNLSNFAPSDLNSVSIVTTGVPSPVLRLNTNLEQLNPERIYFPFSQQVSVSYIYESAGNSTSLGYFYYQDLVKLGFIKSGVQPDHSDDSLVDSDGNGISDFHEALFQMNVDNSWNLASQGRRCPTKFTFKGKSYYEPELASKDCTATATTEKLLSGSPSVDSARQAYTYPVVGTAGTAASNTEQFSDRGLYNSIPNLLEPRDPKNSNRGIGHLIFLISDDDSGYDTGANLGAVKDAYDEPKVNNVDTGNGIPDYNVSGYDSDGRPLANPPDTTPNSAEDRTVNLGEIQGDQEIVFFAVSSGDWNADTHAPNVSNGMTFVRPCLSFGTGVNKNVCQLYLKTPTKVFFSKTFLNMDQNPQLAVNGTVATRDIGCPYGNSNDSRCKQAIKDGWLDDASLNRLNTPTYNNLAMPSELAYVKADKSGRDLMPHVFVGAPSTDKYRWILGFEDLAGGGDRDFNDVTFLINKSNGGRVRSGVVSGDLSTTISPLEYTITEVTFRAVDESYFTTNATNPNACSSLPAGSQPRIRYQVAVDCKVCTANCSTSTPTMSANPNPNWVDVPLNDPPATAPGARDQTVTLNDFLERGIMGSQLCWQAIMESKKDECQPTIKNVDVFYKAVKSGDYARAAVSTAANTVLYGTFETPGRSWFDPSGTPPSVRVVDGRPDLSERGHLYLKQLYIPEIASSTTGTKLWDEGSKLASDMKNTSADPLDWRKLITMNPQGQRAELKDVFTVANPSEAFNDSNCGPQTNNGGHWKCDLNASGGVPDSDDRAVLRNWLYGWETRTNNSSTDKRRTWAMGGVQLSTPAIIGAATLPDWLQLTRSQEQSAYTANFLSDTRVSGRRTMAYVGSTQGYLHGVKAGNLRMGDDICTPATATNGKEANGYFQVQLDNQGHCPALAPGSSYTRDYGDATEAFAYLPRKLLPYYVGSYLGQGNGDRSSVDASPSVADVDLGTETYDTATRAGTYNPTKGPALVSADQMWKIGDKAALKPTQGAKTVLVSATGPSHSVLFSLDITDPSNTAYYPLPMWEFDMSKDTIAFSNNTSKTVEDAFADPSNPSTTLTPDSRGSRHSPPLVRMDFGKDAGTRWVAVVGTDYVPPTGFAGSLFLMDMKTGLPVQVPGSPDAARVAGVIPLAKDEGIAGEPAALDYNQDGSAELIYVATTKGKIFRIATNQVNAAGGFGRVLQVCKLADVQAELAKGPSADYIRDAPYSGVFSSMAVQAYSGPTSSSAKTVRMYVGTANNPDISTEPADLLSPQAHGYVLAFEDTSPVGTSCPATGANKLWIQQLGVGQQIWGGLALNQDPVTKTTQVNTTTAVGKAANACSLSSDQSGMLYTVGMVAGQPTLTTATELGAHSLAAPVIHDQHMIMLTADGKVLVKGSSSGGWNNNPPAGSTPKATIRMWDADPSGDLKQ